MSEDLKALSPEENDDMVERLGRVGSFAPGNYVCQCIACKVAFMGDKRALNCLPCAVSALTPKPASPEEREAVTLAMIQAGERVEMLSYCEGDPTADYPDVSGIFRAMRAAQDKGSEG